MTAALDAARYAAATEVCGRLAGRLGDDALAVVRAQFLAGETELALSALLLNLRREVVGLTEREIELVRSLLADPADPDLGVLRALSSAPPTPHRFSPTGPPEAPDPAPADRAIISVMPAVRARRLRRVWRDSPPAATTPPTWVYLVHVGPRADELRVHGVANSRQWVSCQRRHPIEVVPEGSAQPSYLASASGSARQIWSAD